MATEYNIQVINYAGDLDSYSELNLIGPFEDEDERDTEILRLRAIRELKSLYGFQATDASVDTVDAYVVSPEHLVDVFDEETFEDNYWQ